jgi:hypothetical protein
MNFYCGKCSNNDGCQTPGFDLRECSECAEDCKQRDRKGEGRLLFREDDHDGMCERCRIDKALTDYFEGVEK